MANQPELHPVAWAQVVPDGLSFGVDVRITRSHRRCGYPAVTLEYLQCLQTGHGNANNPVIHKAQ